MTEGTTKGGRLGEIGHQGRLLGYGTEEDALTTRLFLHAFHLSAVEGEGSGASQTWIGVYSHACSSFPRPMKFEHFFSFI